jgi:FkbM family methyltransferase
MDFISYSQNLEDVILWRALKNVEKGFYIDIGGYDPEDHSVTKAFYERGWCGINVKPVSKKNMCFQKERLRDINLEILISDQNHKIDFYEIHETGNSTAGVEIAQIHSVNGFEIQKTTKSAVTLSFLFEKFVRSKEVHFLKINIEGFEEKALKGLDLSKYRPWIILVESTKPLTQIPSYTVWEHILSKNNYVFVYDDGVNRFYLANEHSEMRQSFGIPPNVFDNFVKNSEVQLKNKNVELTTEVGRLGHELDLIRKSKSWRMALNISRVYNLIRLRKYGSGQLMSDMSKILKHRSYEKWCNLILKDLVPPSIHQLTFSQRPRSRTDWKSEVISEDRFKQENFFIWTSLLRDKPRLHSKQFQNYAIMEGANSVLDLDYAPKKAIGFGVGIEPIPAALAKIGFHVTATDYLDGEISEAWKNTEQLIESPSDLNSRGILTPDEFEELITFINMDMNSIPSEFHEAFHFVWSSCALGHIGGYKQGLEFLVNSANLLMPGGIAIHSTELDVSPGTDKYDSPTLSLYRLEDLIECVEALRRNGFTVAELDIDRKWNGKSEKFVDSEPWGERPHLRIDVFGREILSIVIRIERPV